jgi:hypothetical protein
MKPKMKVSHRKRYFDEELDEFIINCNERVNLAYSCLFWASAIALTVIFGVFIFLRSLFNQ